MFTDIAARNLKPSSKTRRVADTGGLYLWVYPTGTKTWMVRSRSGGTGRWLVLGDYPALSLAKARDKTAALRGALPERVTAQEFYETWIKQIRKTYKSPEQVEARFRLYFLSTFGGRVLSSLTKVEVMQHLTEIADRAPVAANRFTTDLKLYFKYAKTRGMIELSPLEGIERKDIGGKEKSRTRTLTDEELAQLIAELQTERFAPATRYALALLLLTGRRSGEVRGMSKQEIVKSVWTLPPERSKNGVACSMTVVSLLSAVLHSAFKELGATPFEGMEPQVLSRAMSRMRFTPPANAHDLRRTMATRMADLGILPHVIEKCLNHKMGGVMGIYNRAEYKGEADAARRLWWRHLLSLRKKAPGAMPRA